MKKPSVADIVTAKIITQLEAGIVPWRKPWVGGWQSNLVTKKPYHGINQWLLQIEKEEKNYTSDYWLTFKQAIELGGDVTGQKSTPVVFWSVLEKKADDTADNPGEEKKKSTFGFLRYYRVFNADQAKGLKLPPTPDKQEVITKQKPEGIITAYLTRENITLTEKGGRAYYAPGSDSITIPSMQDFESSTARYATLFHEMVHSTGHASRLDRFKTGNQSFGSEDYSKEELIAELGSAILCNESGIEPNIQQSASYIGSWLKVLKNDSNMVISASSKAEKATNYILTGEK